jgi:hypothetical protein
VIRDVIDVGQLGRAYDVPLIDYERPGWGLLITCGAGLIMAGMDALPSARWVLSSEGLKAEPPARYLHFAEAAGRLVSYVAAYTLFGMDIPEPVSLILRQFPAERVCWYSNRPLGVPGQCSDLDQLAAAAAMLDGTPRWARQT